MCLPSIPMRLARLGKNPEQGMGGEDALEHILFSTRNSFLGAEDYGERFSELWPFVYMDGWVFCQVLNSLEW